jgi:hypothetical protein
MGYGSLALIDLIPELHIFSLSQLNEVYKHLEVLEAFYCVDLKISKAS